jgi:hypothetical protein
VLVFADADGSFVVEAGPLAFLPALLALAGILAAAKGRWGWLVLGLLGGVTVGDLGWVGLAMSAVPWFVGALLPATARSVWAHVFHRRRTPARARSGEHSLH